MFLWFTLFKKGDDIFMRLIYLILLAPGTLLKVHLTLNFYLKLGLVCAKKYYWKCCPCNLSYFISCQSEHLQLILPAAVGGGGKRWIKGGKRWIKGRIKMMLLSLKIEKTLDKDLRFNEPLLEFTFCN